MFVRLPPVFVDPFAESVLSLLSNSEKEPIVWQPAHTMDNEYESRVLFLFCLNSIVVKFRRRV